MRYMKTDNKSSNPYYTAAYIEEQYTCIRFLDKGVARMTQHLNEGWLGVPYVWATWSK